MPVRDGWPVDRFGFPRADPRFFRLDETDRPAAAPVIALTAHGQDHHTLVARVEGPVSGWQLRLRGAGADTGWITHDDLDDVGPEFRHTFARPGDPGQTRGSVRAVNRGGEGASTEFTVSPP